MVSSASLQNSPEQPHPNSLRQRHGSTKRRSDITTSASAPTMAGGHHSTSDALTPAANNITSDNTQDDLCFPAFGPPPLPWPGRPESAKHDRDVLMKDARNRNAFFFDPKLKLWEKIQYVLMWIPLIPILRGIIVMLLVFITLLYCSIVMWLPQRMQRNAIWLGGYNVRALLLVLGFWYIPVYNRPRGVGAPVIVCNHTNFLDILVVASEVMPSFLAKQDVLNIPVVKQFCRFFQVIGVDRESSEGRKKSRNHMQDHVNRFEAQPHSTPPLLIFPEGTTSRENVMIRFKTGAFSLGKPVQPMLLVWHRRDFDLATLPTTPMKLWFLRVFSQLLHTVSIVYLPIYHPSAAEVADPQLFADNVNAVMLRELRRRSRGRAMNGASRLKGHTQFHGSSETVEDFLIWKKLIETRKPKVPNAGLLGYSGYQLVGDITRWINTGTHLQWPMSLVNGKQRQLLSGHDVNTLDVSVTASDEKKDETNRRPSLHTRSSSVQTQEHMLHKTPVSLLAKSALNGRTRMSLAYLYVTVYSQLEPGGKVFSKSTPDGFINPLVLAAAFGMHTLPSELHDRFFKAFTAPLGATRKDPYFIGQRMHALEPIRLHHFVLAVIVHSLLPVLWANALVTESKEVCVQRAVLRRELADAWLAMEVEMLVNLQEPGLSNGEEEQDKSVDSVFARMDSAFSKCVPAGQERTAPNTFFVYEPVAASIRG